MPRLSNNSNMRRGRKARGAPWPWERLPRTAADRLVKIAFDPGDPEFLTGMVCAMVALAFPALRLDPERIPRSEPTWFTVDEGAGLQADIVIRCWLDNGCELLMIIEHKAKPGRRGWLQGFMYLLAAVEREYGALPPTRWSACTACSS